MSEKPKPVERKPYECPPWSIYEENQALGRVIPWSNIRVAANKAREVLYLIGKIIYFSNESYGDFYAESCVMFLQNKTSVYLLT